MNDGICLHYFGRSACVVVDQTSFSVLVSMSGWSGVGAFYFVCKSMSTAYQTCISTEQRKSCFPRYGRFKRGLCGGFLCSVKCKCVCGESLADELRQIKRGNK